MQDPAHGYPKVESNPQDPQTTAHGILELIFSFTFSQLKAGLPISFSMLWIRGRRKRMIC